MKSDCGYSMQEGVTVGVLLFVTISRARKNEGNGWIVAATPGVLV